MRTPEQFMKYFIFSLLRWFVSVCVMLAFIYILEICNAINIVYFVAAFPCAYLTGYILDFQLYEPPKQVSDDNEEEK
jgi:hypothetical protein